MYIFKNAWLSITRNKGRNILIGIIIFVIGLCATITLAIRTSAESLIASYEDAYEVEATLTVARDNLMKNFDPTSNNNEREDMMQKYEEASKLSIEEIENFADSTYVSNYYYTSTANVNSNTLTAASTNSFGGENRGGKMMEGESTDFQIVGYSSIESMEEFVNGSYTITEGEVSTDFTGSNCVISSELATLNNLSVGDKITFVSSESSTTTYTLTISGIYSNNEETQGMQMFSSSANKIITNANYVSNMKNTTITNSPTYVLTSKDVIESFTEELTEKGLSEYLTVTTNLDEVEQETRSISNLKTYATTFLIVTFIIGAVVLFVINMINVRERKYEIGVLRTIGMKKSLLSLQFVTETLIVALFALTLGATVGSLVSVPVANSMLQSEIESSTNTKNNINNNFGGNMMNNKPGNSEMPEDMPENNNQKDMKFQGNVSVDKITSINAAVNITVLLQLLLIGIAITIISSLAAMISIQRFKPLTILKERS